MRTLYAILTEIRKTITAKTFLPGVLLVTALCMTAAAYYGDRGKVYTVLELLGDAKLRQQCTYGSVIAGALGNQYARLFLPIAAGMSFVPALCTERTRGSLRSQIIRTGRQRYAVSKAASVLLCDGLTVLLGFLLFAGAMRLFFQPDPAEETHFLRLTAAKLLSGAGAGFPALLLCTWSNEIYVDLCIPVLYAFVIDSAENLLLVQHPEQAAALVLHPAYFAPTAAAGLLFDNTAAEWCAVLCIPLLTYAAFRLHLERKVDCGA